MSAAAAKRPEDGNNYVIRPSYKQKFPIPVVRDTMKKVLREKLGDGAAYSTELSKDIADEIRKELKTLNVPRYKYIVQVVMGEQKGEGIQIGSRFFWDSDTDKFATESFSNDQLFCVATAYGVYLY